MTDGELTREEVLETMREQMNRVLLREANRERYTADTVTEFLNFAGEKYPEPGPIIFHPSFASGVRRAFEHETV